MLNDGHLHLDKELFEFMKKNKIGGIANASSPKEYETLCVYHNEYEPVLISAGIHPWHVEEVNYEEMELILKQTNIIGEIGLDNVWCQSDMNKQYDLFNQQLAFAHRYHKPVILHLKGMEKEALSYIEKYSNTYLVHWHSTFDCIQAYIDLDCYFTIGPSVDKDESVKEVAKRVPLNRLLIETDGISALSWCENKDVNVCDYASYLKRSIHIIANLRGMSEQELEDILDENYIRFIHS